MKKNKLLSSSLAYTIGNLLIQGISFITLPIYTRVMTQEDFGNYNLYSSWGWNIFYIHWTSNNR